MRQQFNIQKIFLGLGILLMQGCDSDNLETKFTDHEVSTNLVSNQILNESIKQEEDIVKNIVAEKLTPEEYKVWMKNPENGLSKKRTIENIEYRMILLPMDYLVLKEFGVSSITQNNMDQYLDSNDCSIHFLFRISRTDGNLDISKTGISNQEEFTERIKYLSFEMQKDVFLESKDGKDRIPCELMTYERDYSLTPYATFTLAFPYCEISNLPNYRLVYTDKIFNHGKVKFHWNSQVINSLPKISPNE